LTLGLIFGLGLAALLERHDRRLRQPRDFEETLGLPVLAEVHEDKALSRSESSMGELLSHEAGAFQMLRARLRYFNVDRDINSVLVTSAAPGEGKTTIAWNLAASAASSGSAAILIEADFHQATIAERAGIKPQPGLSELLSGQDSLDETVQQVTVEDRQNGKEEARRLDVLVAGSQPPNPIELLESEGMSSLIESFSASHDLVVIDSPPLPVLADAIPLVKMVNGVILVGRVNKTTRDQAQALRVQLESLDAAVLGVVANRTSRARGYYDYYSRGRQTVAVAVEPDDREA
jgi:non-specific protein-tyrosine kinase